MERAEIWWARTRFSISANQQAICSPCVASGAQKALTSSWLIQRTSHTSSGFGSCTATQQQPVRSQTTQHLQDPKPFLLGLREEQ